MTTQEKKIILNQKRSSVVDAFLLWNYNRLNSEQKQAFELKYRAEGIASTMRLEGESVTTAEVRRMLDLP